MKIVSWNVNSLNVRLPHMFSYLEYAQPDVLVLQETKLTDEKFPVAEIEAAGYHVVYSGQKTYNGVAILSKSPMTDVIVDVDDLEDPQRRILSATINGVRVLNLYVVNGKAVGDEKYEHKLFWLKRVTAHIASEIKQYENVVILGDFNIAPEDRDVHDPLAWKDQILCSVPEREALQKIMNCGLVDTFRIHHEQAGVYSWWDYRAGGFRRNQGLRIDLILASPALAQKCIAAGIDQEPRTWERPSDHTPVWAEFAL
ncbi:MAG: exodeoxyribonuclease III [Gammaproteobacteria bacterium]|nr:exodeoxyribonuclease III [Gammaproteobacteria bacterium]